MVLAALAAASPSSASGAEVFTDGSHIVIQGEIVEGDFERFKRAVDRLRNSSDVTVRMNSPGGRVGEAVQIGTLARQKRFATYVDKGLCASACALAWLGGARRIAHPSARIGFHQSKDPETNQPRGNAMIGHYLASLGYPLKTSMFVAEADPNSMNWLAPNSLATIGIFYEVAVLPAGAPETVPVARPERSVDTVRFPDGRVYVGEVRGGAPHGRGSMVWPDKQEYEGSWENGRRHGSGRMRLANGDHVDGQFRSDTLHGPGRFTFASGGHYAGSFADGRFHGHGERVHPDGSRYVGSWIAGQRAGRGKFVYADGRSYDGEWKDGRRDGEGVFRYASGATYAGRWEDGLRKGEGTWTNSTGRETRAVYFGGLRTAGSP